MKVLACLLLAAVCSAQLAPKAAAPAQPAAPASAAPAGGPGAAGGAGPAAGPAARPVLTQAQLGPAFYGQGLNNPIAIQPPQFVLQRAQQYAANRPNVRVRVNADGTVELTDIYGQEYEDPTGIELALDPEEIFEQVQLQAAIRQEQALLTQQAQIAQRRQQFELQLAQEFGLGGNAAGGNHRFSGQTAA